MQISRQARGVTLATDTNEATASSAIALMCQKGDRLVSECIWVLRSLDGSAGAESSFYVRRLSYPGSQRFPARMKTLCGKIAVGRGIIVADSISDERES